MEFKKYDDPEEFVRENEELILEKEWLNNLMAGNYLDAVKEGINENRLLARITEGEQRSPGRTNLCPRRSPNPLWALPAPPIHNQTEVRSPR